MFGNSKRKLLEKFKASWGKPKTDAFNFDAIELYFRKKDNSTALQVIFHQTINDIDFYKLFAFTDRTHSRIGQQYLFNRLLAIKKAPDFIGQEKLIGHFAKNEQDRLNTQFVLHKLNDDRSFSICHLFLDDFIEPPGYLPLIKVLSILSFMVFMAMVVWPKLGFLLICLFAINLFLHYPNKKHIEMYSGSIPKLSQLCRCIRELLKINLPVVTDKTVVSSLESIEKLESRMSIFAIESRQTADPVSGMVYMLVEYIKIQFLLEPIIVFSALERLKERRKSIKYLYEFFGKIDVAISIASLRCGLNHYCIPKITMEHKGIGFDDLYHPLVQDCITNSMDTKEKSILLTGSNMSGKSTFIRSLSISTLFAQTINTCFASDFQLSPMKIFSAIRISDDVLNGKSYYFEEVLAINEMIRESKLGSKTLFLLDEIFKGTNTIERIAAGKAVLSYICKNGNTVFVSTHDIELAGLLNDAFDLYHFTETVVDNKVHFDYKLKCGELKTRNAIRILEINGYPEEIIEEAKEISDLIIGFNSKNG
jgi:hypothetical protein